MFKYVSANAAQIIADLARNMMHVGTCDAVRFLLDIPLLSMDESFDYFKLSNSLCHMAQEASLGIFQSPLGERLILPTFPPSGIQERLNC